MTDEQKLKALSNQLDDVLTAIGKLQEQVVGIKRKLEGVNPVGDGLALFNELWCARYAPGAKDVRYAFAVGKDSHALKLVLKTIDISTLKQRIIRYFGDREDFLVKTKHPFNIFISRINSYAASPGGHAAVQRFDCSHTPRCEDDVTHTFRAFQDRQATT